MRLPPPLAWVMVVITMALAATTAQTQTERQHGAHVHGHARGSLAHDGRQWALALEIPGANLVGFEHPPTSEHQRVALSEALALLQAGAWLGYDPDNGCRLAEISAHVHGYSEDQSEAQQDAEPADHSHRPHGHHASALDPRKDPGDHAEFHIQARVDCADGARLRWLELELFEPFPANERMDVDILSDRVQRRARLRPGAVRIDLR